MASERLRMAVLIDGDNISPVRMPDLFAKIAEFGNAVIRHVYGSQTDSKRWLEVSSRFALSSGRRHPQAKGHNATDIEMVIGAMDLLLSSSIDAFCLVTSDSDFTSLAIRLREGGKRIYGFGDVKSPGSFRDACHEFHIVGDVTLKTVAAPALTKQLPVRQAIALLKEAYDACAREGWATLPMATKHLVTHHRGFSPKKYGSAGMKKLICKCGTFEVARINDQDAFRPTRSEQPFALVRA